MTGAIGELLCSAHDPAMCEQQLTAVRPDTSLSEFLSDHATTLPVAA